MPELLAALDAFMHEHRRCGVLDSDVDGDWVWMACDCGASIARSILPHESTPPPQRVEGPMTELDDLRSGIRAKVLAGDLPKDDCRMTWFGPGRRAICVACDRIIGPERWK
jgi:hypothetical protein